MADEFSEGGDLNTEDSAVVTEERPAEQTVTETAPKTEEQTVAPKPVAPTEGKREWWKELKGVQGLDSEEKAIEWAVKGQEGIQRAYSENAQLRKGVLQLQKELEMFKKPQTSQELKWTDLLLKHSQKDAQGNIVNTDYDAAWKEGLELYGQELMKQFKSQTQVAVETEKTAREIDAYSRQGIIPEYRPAQYDEDGNLVRDGSEFANEVDGYLAWGNKHLGEPFSKHPYREFLAMALTLGMKQIAAGKSRMKEKVKEVVSTTGGGRTVKTSVGYDPSTATMDEITAENERIKAGGR